MIALLALLGLAAAGAGAPAEARLHELRNRLGARAAPPPPRDLAYWVRASLAELTEERCSASRSSENSEFLISSARMSQLAQAEWLDWIYRDLLGLHNRKYPAEGEVVADPHPAWWDRMVSPQPARIPPGHVRGETLLPWASRGVLGALTRVRPLWGQFMGAWPSLLDWVDAARPDLGRFTVEEALEASAAWHASLAGALGFGLPVRDGIRVFTWPDGGHLDRIVGRDALRAEGASMGHCIGGPTVRDGLPTGSSAYIQADRDGNGAYFSYRNAAGIPQATVEVTLGPGSPGVDQVRGPRDAYPAGDVRDRLRPALYVLMGALTSGERAPLLHTTDDALEIPKAFPIGDVSMVVRRFDRRIKNAVFQEDDSDEVREALWSNLYDASQDLTNGLTEIRDVYQDRPDVPVTFDIEADLLCDAEGVDGALRFVGEEDVLEVRLIWDEDLAAIRWTWTNADGRDQTSPEFPLEDLRRLLARNTGPEDLLAAEAATAATTWTEVTPPAVAVLPTPALLAQRRGLR